MPQLDTSLQPRGAQPDTLRDLQGATDIEITLEELVHPADGPRYSGITFAHDVARGIVLAVPLVYLVTLGLFLLVGTVTVDAFVLALWPALVGGPFVGGFLGFTLAEWRREHHRSGEETLTRVELRI